MGLYAAMRVALIERGPLDDLYLNALPAVQAAPHGVDVAVTPISGSGATRYMGSAPVTSAPYKAPDGGPAHDGGVLWHHTGLQIECRGWDDGGDATEAALATADLVRDTLAQYRSPVTLAGVEIQMIDITQSPAFFEIDDLGRQIMLGIYEVLHAPALDRGDDGGIFRITADGEGLSADSSALEAA